MWTRKPAKDFRIGDRLGFDYFVKEIVDCGDGLIGLVYESNGKDEIEKRFPNTLLVTFA